MSLRNVSSSASRSLSRVLLLPENPEAALGELTSAGESIRGSSFSSLGLDAANVGEIAAEVGGVVSVMVGRGEESAGEDSDRSVTVGESHGGGGGGRVLGVASDVDVVFDGITDGGSPTTMTELGWSHAAVGPTTEDGVPPMNDVSPVIDRGSEGSRTRNSRRGENVASRSFSCSSGAAYGSTRTGARRFRRKKYAARARSRMRPQTPPTMPPTMAPMDLECLAAVLPDIAGEGVEPGEPG